MSEMPDILLLTNDRGERVGFRPVATIPYGDGVYMILEPVTPMEGAEAGDGFVFSVSQVDGDSAEDTGSYLRMETDEAIIDAVFKLYESTAE